MAASFFWGGEKEKEIEKREKDMEIELQYPADCERGDEMAGYLP